jgi:hypothetical protein
VIKYRSRLRSFIDFGHGAVNVSNVGGTALWALDYTLFASTQGVERIYYHEGVGYKYNFVSLFPKYMNTIHANVSQIQPVTLYNSPDDDSVLEPPEAPHVQVSMIRLVVLISAYLMHSQPAYYGAIIGAEAIGSSGSAEIVELAANSAYVVGYAFYESGTLKRALFSNAQAYLWNSTSARSSTQISLSFNGNAPESMTIKRLAVP